MTYKVFFVACPSARWRWRRQRGDGGGSGGGWQDEESRADHANARNSKYTTKDEEACQEERGRRRRWRGLRLPHLLFKSFPFVLVPVLHFFVLLSTCWPLFFRLIFLLRFACSFLVLLHFSSVVTDTRRTMSPLRPEKGRTRSRRNA